LVKIETSAAGRLFMLLALDPLNSHRKSWRRKVGTIQVVPHSLFQINIRVCRTRQGLQQAMPLKLLIVLNLNRNKSFNAIALAGRKEGSQD